MQVLRAVNAQAHQETVLPQELAPRIIQQQTIGLQIVFDPLTPLVFLLQLDHPAKKVKAQKRWFAAVPTELDGIGILFDDALANNLLQDLVRHANGAACPAATGPCRDTSSTCSRGCSESRSA